MTEEQNKLHQKQFAEEWAKDEKDPTKWKINRVRNYPSWRDQLEKIADDGIEKWKTDMIEPVKKKFPKK